MLDDDPKHTPYLDPAAWFGMPETRTVPPMSLMAVSSRRNEFDVPLNARFVDVFCTL